MTDNTSMTDALLLEGYKRMIKIRRFEQLVESLYTEGRIKGTLHLSVGQEAIGAGVGLALQQSDILLLSHRPDHYIIGRDIPFTEVLTEFIYGTGGQMHFFSTAHGIYGSYSIVGSQLPIATGIALANEYQHTPRGIFCTFGDGTTTEGIFHETMNLAALKSVPIVYLCENNQYAQSTSVKVHSANTALAQKVSAMYGIQSAKIDGNDIMAVYDAVSTAKEYITTEKKPYFIEMATFRHSGHSINDKDQSYKSEGEEYYWEQKDPLKMAQKQLQMRKLLREDTELKIEAEINKEIHVALESLAKDKEAYTKLANSSNE
ncbi:MAG: thiamine pyrophosphate-dependent dehydrogenase E1 component subunit alpha [Candidatus Dojkabacteria bacterium]|nr:MAG: thiamine pyrophosphate-dependent dehydrogenase E1 component subunit alpha [Candidatus Dojkabacteria bacterium]